MADFATRSIGIGYPGGSLLLFGMVLASLWIWYRATGSINFADIHGPRAEMIYWVTITLSQTLGTALGDFLDKPVARGGLELSRPIASAVLMAAIIVLIVLVPQQTSSRPEPSFE